MVCTLNGFASAPESGLWRVSRAYSGHAGIDTGLYSIRSRLLLDSEIAIGGYPVLALDGPGARTICHSVCAFCQAEGRREERVSRLDQEGAEMKRGRCDTGWRRQ